VHVGGSGYEHVVPVPPGRALTNSPGLLAETHAVTVVGMIVALNGRLTTYLDQQARRLWRPHMHRPIRGQTLLVVGLGRVGAATARLARLLGMRVVGVKRRATPHPDADEVVAFDGLHAALGAADVVSVHLRAEPATRHAFDHAAFAAMRPGAIFLNTARGSLVDEAALAEALRSGHVAAAHLDVTESEPLPPASPLWDLPNLVITPHVADAVETWPRLFAEAFAENLSRWNAGKPLLNRIEPDPSHTEAGG
jgi:phosphoglycerate dehydrogenase-like enzyme